MTQTLMRKSTGVFFFYLCVKIGKLEKKVHRLSGTVTIDGSRLVCTACNYGLNGGGRRACRHTYAAKPYASWPGWCVNYGQNVIYSISITGKMRPTNQRGKPMHGRLRTHPVGTGTAERDPDIRGGRPRYTQSGSGVAFSQWRVPSNNNPKLAQAPNCLD